MKNRYLETGQKNKTVAFRPYTDGGINYINTMQSIIEEKYHVIDYRLLKAGFYDLCQVDILYLNWLESSLDEADRRLLRHARLRRIKIIWVFHNRMPHEAADMDKVIDDMRFLIKISNSIIIHSHTSYRYLQEYFPSVNLKKIHFVHHPNYIGCYNNYGRNALAEIRDKSCLVFGFIGQIRPYKNIEILLEAFCRLKQEMPCYLLIAGRSSLEYKRELAQTFGELNGEESGDVLFQNRYVGNIEMQSYLDAIDVLVLPYSLDSSMNSGVMIMAFSYKKTVIVPDICMTDDFDSSLFYKYHYDNAQEHVHELYQSMKKACLCGKAGNKEKGESLYEAVYQEYGRDTVRNELLPLLL